MLRLLALLVAVASTGCAHDVSFRSDPPGADVYVDGEKIGTTPVQWREPIGDEGVYDVEVRRGPQLERFTMKKEGWSVPTMGAVAGACLGSALGVAVFGGMVFAASVVLAVPTFGFGLVLAPIGFAGLLVGAVAFWPAVIATAVVTWLYGRIGPDVVFVDMDARKVTAQPEKLVGPPLAPPRRGRDEPHPPELTAPPPIDY